MASFAKAGARGLVLVARSNGALDEIERETKAAYPGTQILSVHADVTNEKSVAVLFDVVKERFGSADILVNNAGISTPGLIQDVDISACWKDFVRHMIALLRFQRTCSLADKPNFRHVGSQRQRHPPRHPRLSPTRWPLEICMHHHRELCHGIESLSWLQQLLP